ncbi:hypothetical protein DEJ46_00025 [Streptomyces venezuelae]|uniref:Uncharacterized protein n=1 Tax=Streptomyces venezuelae TaxID=54571 RepID=A0A5P2AI10_STRVZ|nr:hypothetical protein DEJ46_00025 [Streptomyces venezuelae]
MNADASAAWVQIRNQIDWTSAAGEVPATVEPIVDGLTTWCGAGGRSADLVEAGDCSGCWLSRAQTLLIGSLSPARF